MLKYICRTRMNSGKEWAREHSLRPSSGKTLFFLGTRNNAKGQKWSFLVVLTAGPGFLTELKSRTFKVLRSTIKLKTPAGNMPVQVVTSRCPMAVLVELCFSPEGHNRGVLTGDSSLSSFFIFSNWEDCQYKSSYFRSQLVTKPHFGLQTFLDQPLKTKDSLISRNTNG